MTEDLDLVLPLALGFAAILYFLLAFRIARVTSSESNAISFFLFLVGARLAGSALTEGSSDLNLYGIGQTLAFFGGGFLPVVLYIIYRELTIGRPHPAVLAILFLIPSCAVLLAITNPLHQLVWDVVETGGSIRYTRVVEHGFFTRVYAPFAYGLFGYAMLALASRLPAIARAHRRPVVLLLVGAGLPYAVSIVNTLLGVGPTNLPYASMVLAGLWPLYWWATVSLRVHEFSPLAYQTLFDHVRDPIVVLDRAQRIISANQPAQSLLQAREDRLVGQRLGERLPEAQEVLDHADGRNFTQTVELDEERYFELTANCLVGPSGQYQGAVLVCRDVTERNNALRALADSEHLIRSLIEHSSNGILRFARDPEDEGRRFRCVFANRAADRYLGNSEGSLVGMPLEKLELLEPSRLLVEFEKDRANSVSFETAVETDAGEAWLRVIGEPVGADFSVTLIDITQRKRNENQILADAMRDPLTGALNRRGFEKEAGESIANEEQGAVLYLDLNHFKNINDRFGHQVGDALLKAFGHRLEFCLRPEDKLARLGGDEFAIVLPGVSVEDAKHVAERLVDTASEAYIIQGEEINCTASVGVALMPTHGTELWQLVSVADQAMYNAKAVSRQEAANDRATYVEASTGT